MQTDPEKPQYVTKVGFPRHLFLVAQEHSKLISQVTLDAYNFIFARSNKNLKVATCVAISVAALMQEYETGKHTKVKDVDFKEIIDTNKVELDKDGRANVEMHLPGPLYDIAAKNHNFIKEASIRLAKSLKAECGGSKELACALGLIVAQTVYYNDEFL